MVATILMIFLRINYFGLHIFQSWTPHFRWTPPLNRPCTTHIHLFTRFGSNSTCSI